MEILAPSFQTLEFWSYFNKRGSCHLFLANTWILAQFLYTLVVLSYPSKHWDTGPISTSIGIMILSWKRWNSGSIFILIGILILPLQIILLFYPYFYRHRNSDLILPDIGIQNSIIVILAFFFQTLEFLSHSFTANIEILAPSFETCEFWFFFFFNIAIPILSFQTLEFWAYVLYTLAVWSYYPKHWDCGPISVSTGIIILSLQTLKLLPFFIHIRILIFSFQLLVFWSYLYKHRNSDLIFLNAGILM